MPVTAGNRKAAVAAINTSVSPGAVMKKGKWCGAAGLR